MRANVFFAMMNVVWMAGTFLGSAILSLFPATSSMVFVIFAGIVALAIVGSFVVFRNLWVSLPESQGGSRLLHIERLEAQAGLTSREIEVFRLLADGRSLPYVQEHLFISEGTARTHIKHIYAKLGIHSKQELLDVVEGSAGCVSNE